LNEFVRARVVLMVTGVKIVCSGKWKKTKSGRSQKITVTTGRLQTQSLTALTSFGFATSITKYGSCGIKVWVNYKPLRF
jgi:small subunit ribosomal protein S3